MRVVIGAPWSLWRIDALHGAIATVTDGVGLGPSSLPTGPVTLDQVGAVDGPPVPGGALLARLVHTPSGMRATTALCLPACPPPEQVHAWLMALTLLVRVRTPYITTDRLLRVHGDVLVRRCHEWWWGRAHGSTDAE